MRKSPPVRTQKIRRARSEKSACARGEISVRKKIFFRAHGNLFLCARKFIFVRTEILCPAHRSQPTQAETKVTPATETKSKYHRKPAEGTAGAKSAVIVGGESPHNFYYLRKV